MATVARVTGDATETLTAAAEHLPSTAYWGAQGGACSSL